MRARFPRPILTLLLGLIVALGAAPSPAAAFHQTTVHVEAGAWFPSLDIEVSSSRAGLTGDLISGDDIGLDDPDVVLQGGVTLRLAKRHTLRIHGFGVSVDGDGQTSRSFNFAGRTFPVSTGVTSEADAAFFGADYGFGLVHTDPVALGLTVGVRLLSAEASVRAPILGLEGQGEFESALPAVGVHLIVHPFPLPLLKSLALVGRLAGGTIGDEGTFIDVEGGLEWLPIPILAIRVGYRYFHGEGEDGQQQAEFDLSGPYVSATLAF
jgi:hypothetical protein